MCGIAGVLSKDIEDKDRVVGEMVSRIIHRGPDDSGFFVDKDVGLGMRRLSIIDLTSGRQPIFSQDGKSVIFFNGEIYNYKELRTELVNKGFIFKTQTDTEVIIHMYEAYGKSMLTRLRGMFAFCIYNKELKEVFIARDFFGIKPLYYLKDGNQIVAFGSEIKSFLSIPGFVPEVNDDAVVNYLSFQYNPLPETFFRNVYKLPPAHSLTIELHNGKTTIEKYWSFEFNQSISRTAHDIKEEKAMSEKVFDTIKDSVEYHMIADVPVGAFLSGGVDSSIIATLMQRIRGDSKVKTFTVGFETLTEGRESKETSDFLGTEHTEIMVGAREYFEALPKAVYYFDEPVADPSAIGLYFVAEEARKHVKVVLSGEGADELFGGYNIYLAPFAKQKMTWLPKNVLKFFINLPFDFFGKNYLRRVNSKLEEWYIGNASIFSKDELKTLWKADMSKTAFDMKPLYEKVGGLSESTQMQYIDIQTWLVGDILAKADKMTMAHSLELRVPFLDMKVANLARTLPDNFKWKGGVTKYLLREAFKKVIPESTRKRKKLGFPVPMGDWLSASKKEFYAKILSNEYIKAHMDTRIIQGLIDNHTSKKADNSRKIYTLLVLSVWYDTFIGHTK